ncbi:MAG: metallophosphoesterase [Desulfuromonadaceae bacterium]|nr:metallophosphoesterase [Desulfuromonadaceae bacterium]
MPWFLLVFLFIYSLMHLLVLRGIRPLLPPGSTRSRLVVGWMVVMLFTPLITWLLEHGGFESAARLAAWLGYIWMGLLFLAFSAFAGLGIGEMILLATARFKPAFAQVDLCNRHSARLVLLITVVIAGYGLFEARDLRVETIRLSSHKLPVAAATIRIAQVSDLHLGLINREAVLQPVIARLQSLRPDLLVVTGDMVDARINHLDGLSELWRSINPPLGKFAVNGNHEMYAGREQSSAFLEKSGFTLLRQQAVAVNEYLTVVGIDDPALQAPINAAQLLANLPATPYILFLKHRPAIDPDTPGRFDLQLSGHTHRGQIFPFNLLTGLAYPLQDGLTALEAGGYLYASRGTGTWGPPLRWLSPPEISLFEISSGAILQDGD